MLHATSLKASKAPIAIDADSLEVIQSESKAIFSGNVVAKQADMTLSSQKMTVYYEQQKENSPASPLGALNRIEVDGNVRLRTPEESADGAKGLYDAQKNKVFLFGNVLLRRGENVLNGSRLEYDLTTGRSMLAGGVTGSAPQSSSGGSNGRVRGIFIPNQEQE